MHLLLEVSVQSDLVGRDLGDALGLIGCVKRHTVNDYTQVIANFIGHAE